MQTCFCELYGGVGVHASPECDAKCYMKRWIIARIQLQRLEKGLDEKVATVTQQSTGNSPSVLSITSAQLKCTVIFLHGAGELTVALQ